MISTHLDNGDNFIKQVLEVLSAGRFMRYMYTYRYAAATALRFTCTRMLLAKNIARQRVDERCRGDHDAVPHSMAQPFALKVM